MTTNTCPGCHQQSRDGHLCHKCVRESERALAQIADLWPTLQETITRQDHFGAPSEIHADAVFGPLPYRAPASRVAQVVRSELVGWVQVCFDLCGGGWPQDSVPAMCRYLRGHVSKLRKHEAVAELVANVGVAQSIIVRAVDLADRRAPAGPCPEHTADGEPCPGLIVAVYPVDESQRPRMDCTKPTPDAAVCGKSWPPEDWRNLGVRIRQRKAQIDGQMARHSHRVRAQQYTAPVDWLGGQELMTVADAAVIYGVPEGTIREWLRSGGLARHQIWPMPTGRGRKPSIGVNPAQLEPLAEQWRLRRKGG